MKRFTAITAALALGAFLGPAGALADEAAPLNPDSPEASGDASATTIGTGGVSDDGSSATIGSGGTAAAGATSASTLGTGGASTTEDGDYTASIGSGGSAAAADGKVKSRTKINQNPNMLKGDSQAMAHDGGTFSKSKTKTRIKGGELSSDTKTMSHVPGEKPVKDTTSVETSLPE